jgi:hypothetical protein
MGAEEAGAAGDEDSHRFWILDFRLVRKPRENSWKEGGAAGESKIENRKSKNHFPASPAS